MNKMISAASVALAIMAAQPALATTFTRTSPTGGLLPAGVTEIGGVVLDLTGLNGARVVSQTSASSLFVGGSPSTNPLTFGSQSGFDASVLAALGGGLSGASVRITLFDGDNASGDFDFNQNSLSLDTVSFGNFSSVQTDRTSSDGLTSFGTGFGFPDQTLATGFFSLTGSVQLAALFATLSDGTVNFNLFDTSPGDQFFDFRQGIAGSLINVGTGPVVTPPTNVVPGPIAGAGLPALMALGGFVWLRRRKAAGAALPA